MPARFKRLPRFSVYTHKDEFHDKKHLMEHYISLNPHVIALLTSNDLQDVGQLDIVLEEPAITHQSAREMRKSLSPNPYETNDMRDLSVPRKKKKRTLTEETSRHKK
jgi:hypothetical protein